MPITSSSWTAGASSSQGSTASSWHRRACTRDSTRPSARADVGNRWKRAEVLRVVVAGYLLRHPVPGNMYAFLHYVIGLRRLGCDVLYLEESGWPDSCY